MGVTRELSGSPNGAALMLRATLPLIPGASLLPFVAGRGRDVPDTELRLAGARLDAERLAAYARVCGFTLRDTLPVTAPHLLAFPLHMSLMTSGSFPVPAVGLVHVANRIVQHRPIGTQEQLDVSVRATAFEPHPKGRTFSILTEARCGGELAWEERSTMLRRGGGGGGGAGGEEAGRAEDGGGELREVAQWRLPEDLGRRYASVSGDRNPIHMHALSARLFGFPRAIAHGMWTKARSLAALEATLPDSYAVDVGFRRPILLPGRVSFATAADAFAVRAGAGSGSGNEQTTIHLEGKVTR